MERQEKYSHNNMKGANLDSKMRILKSNYKFNTD